MKILIANLLILNIALADIGSLCSVLFKRNVSLKTKDDLTRLDFITKVDDATNFLRSLKVDATSVEINKKILQKIAVVDNQLYQGHYAYAHRAWRGLFRKIEVNYVYVTRQQSILDDVAKMLTSNRSLQEISSHFSTRADGDAFVAELLQHLSSKSALDEYVEGVEKQIRKRNKIIGNNYHEYKLTREHLEVLSKDVNCKDDCDKAVAELLDTMGVGADNVRLNFQDILQGQTRPSMKSISDYVHSTPIVYETRLLKETYSELKAVLRDQLLQAGKLKKIMKVVEKNFPLKKSKLMKIFNLFNDSQARLNHFPKINDIARKAVNGEEKYHLLREANAQFSNDDFLITFARRTDAGASESWREVKAFLENSQDQRMREFFERMTKSEELAKVFGDLPLNQERSYLGKFLTILISGGGGIAYFNFNVDEENEENSVKDKISDAIDQVSNSDDKVDQVIRIILKNNEVIEVKNEAADSLARKEIHVPITKEELEEIYQDTLDLKEVLKVIDQQ